MQHPCSPAVADPLLRADSRLYLPLCIPLRLGVCGYLMLAREVSRTVELVLAAVFTFVFIGLSAKRAKLREVCLWKNYDRLPLIGISAAVLAVSDIVPPKFVSVGLAASAFLLPQVSGLQEGLLAGAATAWFARDHQLRRAAGAMLLVDALTGIQSKIESWEK